MFAVVHKQHVASRSLNTNSDVAQPDTTVIQTCSFKVFKQKLGCKLPWLWAQALKTLYSAMYIWSWWWSCSALFQSAGEWFVKPYRGMGFASGKSVNAFPFWNSESFRVKWQGFFHPGLRLVFSSQLVIWMVEKKCKLQHQEEDIKRIIEGRANHN